VDINDIGLLEKIIAFCEPRSYLRSYTIYGMRDDQALTLFEVHIDTDEHEPKAAAERPSGAVANLDASTDRVARDPTPLCLRRLREVVNVCARLARDRGLRLRWAVRFREKRAEMCEKFGLGPSAVQKADSGHQSRVTTSPYQELSVTGRVSERIAPRG